LIDKNKIGTDSLATRVRKVALFAHAMCGCVKTFTHKV